MTILQGGGIGSFLMLVPQNKAINSTRRINYFELVVLNIRENWMVGSGHERYVLTELVSWAPPPQLSLSA